MINSKYDQNNNNNEDHDTRGIKEIDDNDEKAI